MEKKIIFTTEKNISPKDKEKLCKNGYLVIEVKALSELKYDSDIENNIMFEASMKALYLHGMNTAQASFFQTVYHKKFHKQPSIAKPA